MSDDITYTILRNTYILLEKYELACYLASYGFSDTTCFVVKIFSLNVPLILAPCRVHSFSSKIRILKAIFSNHRTSIAKRLSPTFVNIARTFEYRFYHFVHIKRLSYFGEHLAIYIKKCFDISVLNLFEF